MLASTVVSVKSQILYVQWVQGGALPVRRGEPRGLARSGRGTPLPRPARPGMESPGPREPPAEEGPGTIGGVISGPLRGPGAGPGCRPGGSVTGEGARE